MDIYHSQIAKAVVSFNRWRGWENAAITISQTALFSCGPEEVDDSWHAHEDEHKKQWAKYGFFGFLARYLWWSIWHGYTNNPFEVDARKAAGED